METLLWICLCLFACIGAVELFGRIFYGNRPPKRVGDDFLVIPLEYGGARLKAQLEYYLCYLQWNGMGRVMIFVDRGMDESERGVFDSIMDGIPGVILCGENELCGLISSKQ